SLLLLNYLVRNGSERVVTSAREHIYDLRSLENYTYVDEFGKDQGINVRHKVRELIEFIQDDDKLRDERKKAKKNKDKYVGMSSDAMGMRFGGGGWEDTPRWKKDEFGDWDPDRGGGGGGGGGSGSGGGGGNAWSGGGRQRGFEDSNNSDDCERYDSDTDSGPQKSKAREYKDKDSDSLDSTDKREKSKPSTPSKHKPVIKKIDLGAAANYGKDSNSSNSSPLKNNLNNVHQSTPTSGSEDLFGEIVAGRMTATEAPEGDEDFNPRASETPVPVSADFGDFTSAFGKIAVSKTRVMSIDNSLKASFTTLYYVINVVYLWLDCGQQSNADLLSGLGSFPSVSNSNNLNASVLDTNINSTVPCSPETQGAVVSSSPSSSQDLAYGCNGCNSVLEVRDYQSKKEVARNVKRPQELGEEILLTLTSVNWSSSCEDLEILKELLVSLLEYFPGPLTPQRFSGIDVGVYDKINCTLYVSIFEELLNKYSNNWSLHLKKLVERALVESNDVVLFAESLALLSNFVKEASGISGKLLFVVDLLTKLIQSYDFSCSFLILCKMMSYNDDGIDYRLILNDFIQNIFSLPSKVANKLRENTPSLFMVNTYIKILCCHLGRCVQFLSYAHKHNVKFCILPLTTLLEKVVNHVDINNAGSLSFLLLVFDCWSSDVDYMFVVQSMLECMRRPFVEKLAVTILRVCQNPLSVCRILGNIIYKSKDWKYYLCVKIPLLSCYDWKDPLMLQNLFGYLEIIPCSHEQKCSKCKREVLGELAVKLANVWGDRSAINHSSLEQHIYISQAFILCVKSCCSLSNHSNYKFQIQTKLFSGVPVHLASPHEIVRAIGMVTIEIAANLLYTEAASDKPTLDFDYSGMTDDSLNVVSNLRQLCSMQFQNQRNSTDEMKTNFVESEKSVHENELSKGNNMLTQLERECQLVGVDIMDDRLDVGEETVSKLKTNRLKLISKQCNETKLDLSKKKGSSKIPVSDLDSDDDDDDTEESNDYSNVNTSKQPKYLRDLLEGLLETNDADKFTQSLETCEKLVLAQLPDDDESLGIELIDVLISIEEKFYVENFESLRISALIAVVTVYPAVSAEYICSQFNHGFGKYTISQRILMLDVLMGAAKKLSNLANPKPEKQTEPPALTADIVKTRIEKNTRRFGSAPKHSQITHKNRFSGVVGSFFFPLLHDFGRSKGSFWYNDDLSNADKDYLILTHILRTLHVITMCAVNTPSCAQRGKELLNIVWSLRYHCEAKVRLELMCCVRSVLLSVPKVLLQAELQDQVLECSLWLKDSASTIPGKDTLMNSAIIAPSLVPLTPASANATQLPPSSSSNTNTAAPPIGSTWTNSGNLNINIDNLSITGNKNARSGNAPSMNQMAFSSPTSPIHSLSPQPQIQGFMPAAVPVGNSVGNSVGLGMLPPTHRPMQPMLHGMQHPAAPLPGQAPLVNQQTFFPAFK
ncbi:Clathrin interactor 1, partial [Gryllus bimaculatus]